VKGSKPRRIAHTWQSGEAVDRSRERQMKQLGRSARGVPQSVASADATIRSAGEIICSR